MNRPVEPEQKPPRRWALQPLRALWFATGLSSVALAALGVLLPLLPTTPFLLLAAVAFAQSSQRWHAWLLAHPLFGPMIEDWHRHGAIHPRAKCLGILSMVAALALSWLMAVSPGVLIIQAIALSCSALFVLSRPSPPKG